MHDVSPSYNGENEGVVALQVQTLLLAPICPHTCEHVWRDTLQQQGTVLTAGWPEAPQPKVALQVCLLPLLFCPHCPLGSSCRLRPCYPSASPRILLHAALLSQPPFQPA